MIYQLFMTKVKVDFINFYIYIHKVVTQISSEGLMAYLSFTPQRLISSNGCCQPPIDAIQTACIVLSRNRFNRGCFTTLITPPG